MSERKPTAAGALATTPLPNLLAYLLDRRLTGTLVVEDAAGQKSALFFEQGRPVKARTAEPVVLIGQLLVEMGILRRIDAERAAEQAASEQRLYGAYLVARQMLPAERLEEGLRKQLRRRIHWMMSLPPDTIYGFYEDANLLEHWGGAEGTPVAVLPLVWQGIRHYTQSERVAATLSRLSGGILRLHLEAQPARFQFDRHEQAIVDVLRAKPQTLESLLATGLLEESILRRLVYMLAIARHLDLGTGTRPIGVEGTPAQRSHVPVHAASGGQSPTSTERTTAPQRAARDSRPPLSAGGEAVPPSPATDAQADQRKAELRKQATEVLEQNYYHVLGVDQLASTSTVQAAFFQLAKKWHPDRLEPEFSDLRDLVTRAFARMSEAHALLTDPDKRKEYDRAAAGGSEGDDQEQVARVLRAAGAYQRAEILLKKRALDAAEREAKIAMEGDPDQSDHLALYAWILASKPERGESGEDPIGLLNRAVELGPKNERARFWRGQVLKRAGRLEEATRDFRWVAQNNPRHVDAARELRLHEMRRGEKADRGEKPDERPGQSPRGQSTASAKRDDKPGILAKFFKR